MCVSSVCLELQERLQESGGVMSGAHMSGMGAGAHLATSDPKEAIVPGMSSHVPDLGGTQMGGRLAGTRFGQVRLYRGCVCTELCADSKVWFAFLSSEYTPRTR